MFSVRCSVSHARHEHEIAPAQIKYLHSQSESRCQVAKHTSFKLIFNN